MRVLITGVTGFVGSHLTELLLAQEGVEAFGIDGLSEVPDCRPSPTVGR